MKIITRMTGYGSLFVKVGYKELKLFIKIEQKPILKWIVEGMYPEEKDILFVCQKEHLNSIRRGCLKTAVCHNLWKVWPK